MGGPDFATVSRSVFSRMGGPDFATVSLDR